jgi:hypothetical protein
MIFALWAACHHTPPGPAVAHETLTREAWEAAVRPVAGDVVLAHSASPGEVGFRGGFGPDPDCYVGVVYGSGWDALLVCGERHWRLPLRERLTSADLTEAFFRDVDRDGDDELVVIAGWITGHGPEGTVEFLSNAVVAWDGQALVRLEDVEAQIETLPDLAAVDAALRRGR